VLRELSGGVADILAFLKLGVAGVPLVDVALRDPLHVVSVAPELAVIVGTMTWNSRIQAANFATVAQETSRASCKSVLAKSVLVLMIPGEALEDVILRVHILGVS
jgi:hypothetical protein